MEVWVVLCIKVKLNSSGKDNVKKMRSQVIDMEEIFPKHIYDKGLLSKKYKKS